MKIRLTESKLKQIVEESVKNVLKEGRFKKTPESINIDGVDYEKTDVKGGGMLHPGFRWKDHEMHNPEKSKLFRKRKDGYRYTQSYDGSPRWIHNQLTNESSCDSNTINEVISTDHRSALKQLFTKSFGNLNDNEKQYLYDLLNNETWETVYVALEMLKPYNPNNKVYESKDIISMDSIYNQVLERIVDFLECGDMEIKFGNMNGQSFDVYLPLSEKYLEILYMGKTIKMALNKRVEDLSDESIARIIMNGFIKLYGN